MRHHTEWVQEQVETVPSLPGRVFVSAAPRETKPPYAVLHPRDGADDSDRLTGPAVRQHPFHTIHLVSDTAEGAQRLGDFLKAVFLVSGVGITPDIAGERCEPVEYSVPRAVEVERDVTPWEYFHTSELEFVAEPI